MTIRARLTAALGAVLVITLTGTYAILAVSEWVHLKRAQDRERAAMVERLARVAGEALLNRNDVILLNYLETLRSAPGLAYGLLANPEGVVQAHTDISRLGERAAPSDRPEAPEGIVEWSHRVEAGGRPLGTVRLGFSARALEDQIRSDLRHALGRFLWVVAAALALGFVGAAALAHDFNRPIAALADGAARLGAGRLDTRLETGREDELGRLAAEFNHMAERLQELDEAKDRFLHSVSHEIRSPLTAIRAYAGTLSAEPADGTSPLMRKGLGIIKEETDRLTGFINDILDLAKLEAGRMELAKEPLDAGELVQEVAELFRAKAEENRVELTASDESVWVTGDRDALRRVLVNLTSNALKFTPEKGAVRLSARKNSGTAKLEVRDSGVGVPKEKQSELFKRFSQVHETRRPDRKAGGTGLGLAICKEIVEAHGGSIGVESDLGKGSTFYVLLEPAAPPANQAG